MTLSVKKWLLCYAVAAVVYAAADVAWIATVAGNLYQSQIGHLLAPAFNIPGAVLFYLVFVVGMVHFGVRPQDHDATRGQRVAGAALFGAVSYGTWGLTALAILDRFSALVAVTDIAWGAAVCGVVTFVTVTLLRRTLLAPAPAA